MRTVRLIIYDGPEEWMETQRGRDLKTPYHVRDNARILSIEIDPTHIWISEVPTEVNEGTLHIDAHTVKKIKLRAE